MQVVKLENQTMSKDMLAPRSVIDANNRTIDQDVPTNGISYQQAYQNLALRVATGTVYHSKKGEDLSGLLTGSYLWKWYKGIM